MRNGDAASLAVIFVDSVILILDFIFLLVEGLFQICLVIHKLSKSVCKICCQLFLKVCDCP